VPARWFYSPNNGAVEDALTADVASAILVVCILGFIMLVLFVVAVFVCLVFGSNAFGVGKLGSLRPLPTVAMTNATTMAALPVDKTWGVQPKRSTVQNRQSK